MARKVANLPGFDLENLLTRRESLEKALLEDLVSKASAKQENKRENKTERDIEAGPKPVHEERTSFSIGLCVGLAVILVVTVFFIGGGLGRPSPAQQQGWGTVRAQTKLKKPVMILLSSDGFRWGYNFKVPTPNIDRLRFEGTEAESGLIPVYPSFTFPNHYSIATGLYPAWHGIVQNTFSDPHDPTGERFNQKSVDPKWWLGEPIWETVTKNGLQAATFFWPGSDVSKGAWTCPPKFCMRYNGSVSSDQRVDTVLSYFDLPSEEMPSQMSLYFESPDLEGHQVGPDSPEVSLAVSKIDAVIGRLISGLEQRGVFEDVDIIFVGDHGMAGTCDSKVMYIEDFEPWVKIDEKWIDTTGAIFGLRPPSDVNVTDIYSKLQEGLASGKVKNSEFVQMYLKEDLPERFLYSSSDRVQPIIGVPAEGFRVAYKRTGRNYCGGSHGYDNTLLSMRTVFIGHGPHFARGRKVPSFINVELYNVFTSILRLKVTAPNNGTYAVTSTVLLPSA